MVNLILQGSSEHSFLVMLCIVNCEIINHDILYIFRLLIYGNTPKIKQNRNATRWFQ